MAYRLPHVVMGDRSGNIRWWDVTTRQSSSFITHRDGIRRIKFSPGDRRHGRIAVLFYDNTFSVFDLKHSYEEILAKPLGIHLIRWLISILPQFPGTRVLELDWLPLRTNKDDSLALRMILQLGVKPLWFDAFSSVMSQDYSNVPGTPSAGDLRKYMIDSPPCVADYAVPNMLLKVLEPYHREACLLDDERVRLYSKFVKRGSTLRLAFAAAVFGKSMEALFWLQLPHDLNHPMNKLADKLPQKGPHTSRTRDVDEASMFSRMFKKNHCPSRGMLWLLKLG
ncbi:hypothetical protein OROMI_002592 [Orobanche minor]